MREYDTTFIVQPEISEESREGLIVKLGEVLERAGAMPLEVEDIGKKRLAYDIRDFQKGHYLSLFFLDAGNAVKDLERSMRLDESVLRFLTVRKAEDVIDVEARKARAVEAERIRKERAEERAAREAEERVAREAARIEAEAEAAARAETEQAEAAARAETEQAEAAARAETEQAEAAARAETEQAEAAARAESEQAEAAGETSEQDDSATQPVAAEAAAPTPEPESAADESDRG